MKLKACKKHFRFSLCNVITVLILIAVTDCKLTFDTDIKSFLKENTEKATIIGYTTNLPNFGSAYISEEHPEYYCIPSTQDLVITYELRNPHNYIFKLNDSMLLDFTNKDTFVSNFGILADPASISIYQGTENEELQEYENFYITVTIPKDFLSASEYGLTYNNKNINHTNAHDITPLIQLYHPKNHIDFGQYGKTNKPLSSELHIISNSAPPTIYGPAVYQKPIEGNESYSNYMLLFNMPSTGLLKENHKDVNLLTIQTEGDGTSVNGARTYEFSLDVKEDGTFTATPTANSYGNARIISGNPADEKSAEYDSKIVPSGAAFDMRGQPYYLLTDHVASSKDIIYTMTLKDDWGLKTSVQANARSVRLADFFVTDEITDKGNLIQQVLGENAELQQDEGSSYATVNFIPAFNTYWFIDSEKNIQNKYFYVRISSIDPDTEEEIINYYSPDAKELEGLSYDVENNYFDFDLEGNLIIDDFWKEHGYVSLKDSASENYKYVSVKKALDNGLLDKQTANTSGSSIIYEVYQGKDDKGNALLNGSFDCEKSEAGSVPTIESYITEAGNNISILNHDGSNMLEKGHYLPLQIPSGYVFVRVYSHLKGYADTLPREFGMRILRTIAYVANENPENGGSDLNTGSENSPFATITKALKLLSVPENEKNTIYLKSDVTESISIPAKGDKNTEEEAENPVQLEDMKVTIASKSFTENYAYTIKVADNNKTILNVPANAKVVLKNVNLQGNKYENLVTGADTLISIDENATVVFENCKISNCNIKVASGAKVYLNDVQFDKGIIYENDGAAVILGGNTKIKAEKDDNGNSSEGCAMFLLEEGGVVQLGSDDTQTPSKKYTARDLIFITTEKAKPNLNVVVLECENKNETIKDAYEDIYYDIIADVNPYQIFALSASGGSYYIYYMDEEGKDNFGKGIVRIPAAYVNLPSVGGFTLELNGEKQKDYWIYNNSTASLKTDISIKFIRNEFDYSDRAIISNKKLQLKLEGDIIETAVNSNSITIPAGYPSGKYELTVYFEFDGITYSETFNLYLKEAE